MTDLLCSWLNQEVAAGISEYYYTPLANISCLCVGNDSFAEECSNGYLYGQILNKYGLQVCERVVT